jgi:ADP-ribose pyrophosphatase
MPAKSKQRKATASKAARPAVKKGAVRKPAPSKTLKAVSEPDAVVPVVKELKINPGRKAKVLSSELKYEVPLFRIYNEQVKESGKTLSRDIIRHNGSVVILPVDSSKSKRNPYIVLERQYRHAAGQFLYEVPAGKMEPGENRLRAAKRELLEETGYTARKWTHLTRYFASPGFLGEWMQVFLAEELVPGPSCPEDDESIELLRVPLSELLRLIDRGQVQDGKTLVSVLSFARLLGQRK